MFFFSSGQKKRFPPGGNMTGGNLLGNHHHHNHHHPGGQLPRHQVPLNHQAKSSSHSFHHQGLLDLTCKALANKIKGFRWELLDCFTCLSILKKIGKSAEELKSTFDLEDLSATVEPTLEEQVSFSSLNILNPPPLFARCRMWLIKFFLPRHICGGPADKDSVLNIW